MYVCMYDLSCTQKYSLRIHVKSSAQFPSKNDIIPMFRFGCGQIMGRRGLICFLAQFILFFS